MIEVVVGAGPFGHFEDFREAARPLLARGVPPCEVRLRDRRASQLALFGAEARIDPTDRPLRLSRAFVALAETVACARDEDRWDLLYGIAHRLLHGEPDLLERLLDREVEKARGLEQAIRRDVHAAHAFVRFRAVEIDGEEHYLAWYRPDHRILRLVAPHFEARFSTMRWTIATPDETVRWDRRALCFGPGLAIEDPEGDAFEDLFRAYYGAAFNPARTNLRAMRADMPARRWSGLPELADVPRLLAEAPARLEEMAAALADAPRGEAPIPPHASLPVLREAATSCRACAICERATQTVFGEGPSDARIVLVGEQPGDHEDRSGRPFVGPAGALLDEILGELGSDRRELYVTNAVKHFKWEPRGKQRLHRSPKPSEVAACRPWLDAELRALSPETVVCLGAVAARSFMGPGFRLHKARGRIYATRWAPRWIATHHPAAILRAADRSARAQMRAELAEDLGRALGSLTELAVASE